MLFDDGALNKGIDGRLGLIMLTHYTGTITPSTLHSRTERHSVIGFSTYYNVIKILYGHVQMKSITSTL